LDLVSIDLHSTSLIDSNPDHLSEVYVDVLFLTSSKHCDKVYYIRVIFSRIKAKFKHKFVVCGNPKTKIHDGYSENPGKTVVDLEFCGYYNCLRNCFANQYSG
jgi:hypothetical protein